MPRLFRAVLRPHLPPSTHADKKKKESLTQKSQGPQRLHVCKSVLSPLQNALKKKKSETRQEADALYMKDTAVTTDEGCARSVLQCLAWMWCKHTLSAVPPFLFFFEDRVS